MPSGKPAPKKKKATPAKTPQQQAMEAARIAHAERGGGAPPNRPGNADSTLPPTPGPLISPKPAWEPWYPDQRKSPQGPSPTGINRTGPTSNVPNHPIQPGEGIDPRLKAAIQAQNAHNPGVNPVDLIKQLVGHIGDLGAQQLAAGPAPGSQVPGGGVQGETSDLGQGEGAPASGFVDPYAAQKAAFEQSYQQAIPQLEALRAQYAGQIQGYGNDAQAQAVSAQGGIQQALAAAQAQNQQGAQGITADLVAQGVDPSKFAAQAASQGGLLTNQGTLQDALSKRLAQVQGQQTQSNLTASDLASQGARQNLELGHVTGQAAYTDKTAAAQNDYQTQMAKIAADEAAATAKASSGGGGGGGSGSSKVKGLTPYQQAQLDSKTATAQSKADALGTAVAAATGVDAEEIRRGLDNGTLSDAEILKDLKDNAGLTGADALQALTAFKTANPSKRTPNVPKYGTKPKGQAPNPADWAKRILNASQGGSF